MTYSILFDCGCGFAINGGTNQFCEIHEEDINNIGHGIDIIMYRAGIGYEYRLYEHDGLISITTKFQEGVTL